MRELIVDSFAGGGGASTGIELALGRSPDYAINHDAEALAMHEANHPETIHLASNIWKIDPAEVAKGRPVGLLWASPDCKHFSKAKGGKPVARNIRDLAWVVALWAKRARPRVIVVENVEEFQDWGPLVLRDDGKQYPCPDRKGATFRKFIGELRRHGYKVDWRELRACDYGAPTIRKRLFLIARRDGRPIVWPAPTHGDPKSDEVVAGRRKPWRTAAECIDWSLPCPSIFDTADEIREKHGLRAVRPLADATMARIAKGVKRYVLDAAEPFIVQSAAPFVSYGQQVVAPFVTKFRSGATGHRADEPLHTVTANSYVKRPGGSSPLGVAAAFLSRQFGSSVGHAADSPAGTITAGGAGKTALVAAFLAQHNGGMVGHDAREPVSTIVQKGPTQGVVVANLTHAYTSNTAGGAGDLHRPIKTIITGGHAALVASFLIKYYGQGIGARLDESMHTETTRDRFGFVSLSIAGEPHVIVDIGMRMLTPRERFRAQGFPDDYDIETGPAGRRLTGAAQGRMCGNSVCPPVAAALVGANCPDLAVAADAGEVAA